MRTISNPSNEGKFSDNFGAFYTRRFSRDVPARFSLAMFLTRADE